MVKASSLPDYPLEDYARTYLFRYADEEYPNLMRALTPPHSNAGVSKWVLQFHGFIGVFRHPACASFYDSGDLQTFHIHSPDRKGRTDSRQDTGEWPGQCRDFAVLMIEGARSP